MWKNWKPKTWQNSLQNIVGKAEHRVRPKQAGGKHSCARNRPFSKMAAANSSKLKLAKIENVY